MRHGTLASLAKKVGKTVTGSTGMESYKGISIDTRTLEPEDIFVALKGPYKDGHDYLKQAQEKGAAACVVQRDVSLKKPYILVDDCYEFLDKLGSFQRKLFKGKVIGLTGSNGKTTTKDIIYTLLSSQGVCQKTKGNKNNHIGVPLTLASLKESSNYAVIEIGTNSPGEIDKLSAKVMPDIALITNAASSHLEKLESKAKVAKEKSYILEHLKKDGTAVLPRDSEFYSYWKERSGTKKMVTFGSNEDSDICLSNLKTNFSKNQISFNLNYFQKTIKCVMNGIGRHNSMNAGSALAVCLALNIDLETIAHNLKKVVYPSRRMEVNKALRGSLIIDDSYNANPESMKKSLDVLKDLTDKKRIFVAGEMAELGKDQTYYHEKICKYANGRVEEFLCIGELWSEGLRYIPEIGKSFSSKEELLDYLNANISEDSVILVKGSRSTGMDYIADKLKV